MKCKSCGEESREADNFCIHCGAFLFQKYRLFGYSKDLKAVLLFYALVIVFLGVVNFAGLENYRSILIADITFAFIVLLFATVNLKSLKRYIRPVKLKPGPLLLLTGLQLLLAIGVHYLADVLNTNILGSTEYVYYDQFADTSFPLLFTIISIAAFPAIFEELAFRGVLFNHLQRITNLKSTIILTTLIFALLHLSVISLIWIIPLGLIFGYLRARYRTIWYGVIGHFMYNCLIVLMEVYFSG